MKFNKSIAIPTFVFALSVLAFTFTISNNYETFSTFFINSYSDTFDSLQTDMIVQGESKDVSQMFNERGYYNSSSYSFDENEIINDFNGNLIYEVPLYNFKHAGDMRYEMKLVYNGSVGHQVNLGNVDDWGDGRLDKHNMNAPEWILSLNGMAVQVFNFETTFFTSPTNSATIEGDNLHMLIPGYHFCNIMKSISTEKDRINLLAGDGSVITLVNKSTTSGASFTGVYHSEGKETHYWADVKFDPTDGSPEPVKNRIIELTTGDGMVFVYKEYKRKYADFDLNEGDGVKRPRLPLLTEIRDRFGYNLTLTYEFTLAPGTISTELLGRPVLTGISANIVNLADGSLSIAYAVNAIKIFNQSSVNGNYRFELSPSVYYTSSNATGIANHKGYVTKITNPLLQNSIITYENNSNYRRVFTGVPNPDLTSPYNSLELKFNSIQRIKTTTNFLGGIREYSYYPLNVNELSISYYIQSFNRTSYYMGNGREPFYTNMIAKKIDKFKSDVSKSETNFEYAYDDGGYSDEEFPVDDADYYLTERKIKSLNAETQNNSPEELSAKREYKVYPVRLPVYNEYPSEINNFTGVTKLIKEEQIDLDNNNDVYLKNEYTYQSTPKTGFQYNGSFLMTSKKNTMKNMERTWNYEYEYRNALNAVNKYDSLVIWKKETDPKNNIAEISFYNFDTLLFFNVIANNYNGQIEEEKMRFYKIGAPTLELRKDLNNTVLAKKSNEYLFSLNDSRGYYAQLISEKNFQAPGFTIWIENKFEYYKMDNEGSSNYLAGSFPYKEGNLKRTIRPNNQEEKYFYCPVSFYEDEEYQEIDAPARPFISYKRKYNTGNTVIQRDHWVDPRLPIRIDSYKRISQNAVDTLKKVYMQYNEAGMPTRMINENRYLTELNYQATHRISTITLPGDFSASNSYDSLYIRETTFPTTMIIPADAWGHVDLKNNIDRGVTKEVTFRYAYPDVCDRFSMAYVTNEDKQWAGFSRIFVDLRNFSQIDSASFTLNHLYYEHTVNGNQPPANDYSTVIQPVDSLYAYGLDDECGENDYRTRGVRIYNNTQTITLPSGTYENCIPITSRFDIKNLLLGMKSANKNVFGMMVKPIFRFHGIEEGDSVEFDENSNLIFRMTYYKTNCAFTTSNFMENYNEIIAISGQYLDKDTIIIPVVIGGTYVYRYDDAGGNVVTYSRLSHSPNILKKIKNHLDGFGKVKQKDIYTNTNDFETFLYKYNYLDQRSEEIDGRDNSTEYSNDLMQRPSETQFADDSISTNSYGYTNSLGSYMGGSAYNGFVEIQEFKDESKKKFYKYFDAVGNLLREMKYVSNSGIDPDNPFDPDTTGNEQDDPGDVELRTDYRYDDLYRLTEVRTPNGKTINYYYDGYGRQRARNTPDAGITDYLYDNNNNLVYSRDANQYSRGANVYTFRNYDAINRLTAIGETQPGGGGIEFEEIDIEDPPVFDNPYGEDMFAVNVYDTLINTSFNNFASSKPTDFYDSPNNTRGNLVATAYRTRLNENWNYKYYRYDARGSVTKMWSYIDGLGWKAMTYKYNSQNQNTFYDYQPAANDGKIFKFGYDGASRLIESAYFLGLWTPSPEEENSSQSFYNLTRYTYNENSQIDSYGHNGNAIMTNYYYNVRNWIKWTTQSPEIFRYVLLYNGNGNIRYQTSEGTYKDNFAEQTEQRIFHIYDKSNRLLTSEYKNENGNFKGKIVNTYDADGNFTVLKRYSASNTLLDNFNYQYFSNTNRLQNVSGQLTDDYSYDNNGNMTKDEVNRNYSGIYDFRNLLTDIRAIRQDNSGPLPVDKTYWTRYWYDEAGNRIRKTTWLYKGSEIEPVFEGDSPSWEQLSNEFYVRDVSGKEIAIYSGTTLTQWNLWGLDQIGHMNLDASKFFYLKDHLGSTRAVINTQNQVVSANDYDPWGYPFENRTYYFSTMKYKFTGKERDNETSYDYFGARFYDSRIGRWGGVEPLLDKYISFSVYCYSICNPILTKDVDGKDAIVTINNETNTITVDIKILYTMEEGTWQGLDLKQEGKLEEFISEANETWNEAGKNIEYKGTTFNVIFNIKAKYFESRSDLNMGALFGENIASSNRNENEIGVNENQFKLPNFSEVSPIAFAGSHEIGHLIGLEHPSNISDPNSVMSHNPNRPAPSAENVKDFLSTLKFHHNVQLVKGVKGAVDKQ